MGDLNKPPCDAANASAGFASVDAQGRGWKGWVDACDCVARFFVDIFAEQIGCHIEIASAFFVAVTGPVVGTPASKEDCITLTA